MKKHIVLFFLLMVCVCKTAGAEADMKTLFAQANEAYRNQDYAKAFEDYGRIAKELRTSEIYYNLGNAAFKMNKLGFAILNYLRARRLAPRNLDIIRNLKYAESLIEYRVDDKRNWYFQQLKDALEFVRLRECLSVFLLFYVILSTTWLTAMLKKRPVLSRRLNVLLITLLSAAAIATGLKLYQTHVEKRAVVVKERVDVRYGPSKSDKLAFSLVEGIQVNVDDEMDHWYQISLTNKESGWVPNDGVEMV